MHFLHHARVYSENTKDFGEKSIWILFYMKPVLRQHTQKEVKFALSHRLYDKFPIV